MTDLIEFLKTPVGAGLLGIVLLAIGFGYFKLAMSERTKGILKLLGVAFVGYAMLTYMNVPIALTGTPPASTVQDFDVVGSDSHSYVTVDQEGRAFTWNTAYNHTGNTIVGASQATLTFSIARGLGTMGLVQTSADVVSVPDVVNGTTDVSASLISKSGTQYNALWTRAGGGTGIETITITIAEDADGASVSLNLTLNSAAIRNMAQYGSEVIHLNVAGQPWTVAVICTSG